MAEKYNSTHYGQDVDSAVTKALNPSTTFNSEDAGKLADAKAVGELVAAEKERAEATYLPYDGYSQLARVGEADVADNLTPYSGDSGTSQNTPFILQGSDCANGEEQADTGSYCQLQRKNGNTVTVNQLVRNPTFVDTSIWSGQKTTFTVENNVARVVCGEEITASMGIYQNILEGYQIPSHKYLLLFTVKPSVATKISAYYAGAYFPIVDVAANTKYWYSAIITLPQSPQGRAIMLYINYGGTSMVEGDYADISNVSLIDLTLWFGSNDKIPTHLLNHPEDFFRYYQGDLSYNVGALTDSNGRYLKTKGRNLYNKETITTGKLINDSGVEVSATGYNHSDYIKVAPNSPYYLKDVSPTSAMHSGAFYDKDKNFIGELKITAQNRVVTVPANCIYIIVNFATAYIDTVCVSNYYEGESGYDQNYPYEELANVDTGNEVLRSAGNACDYKLPSGEITRNIGSVDLGTLNWSYVTSLNGFRSTSLVGTINPPSLNSDMPNIACGKYAPTAWTTTADKAIYVYPASLSGRGAIRIYDSTAGTDAATFKAALSGVYLYYELAEPTTEQGTPFPENVAIDDFGTMSFDCPNGVPQGNTVFYPVDYKAEIDTLHNITEGDMHKIALKGDNLAPTDPNTIKGVVDAYNALYAINQENMGGVLRHMLADKAEIDFANTAWIDLSTLTFSRQQYLDTYYYFRCAYSEIATGTIGQIAHMICPSYKTVGTGTASLVSDKAITNYHSSSLILIRDDSYTDVEAFKASLKGVLLAYEKATT